MSHGTEQAVIRFTAVTVNKSSKLHTKNR